MRTETEVREMLNRFKLQQQLEGYDGFRQIAIVTLEDVLNEKQN